MSQSHEPQETPHQRGTWSSMARTVIVLAVVIGIALGLRALRPVAAPIILGLVIAIATGPLIGWFIKKRVPPILAYIITLLVIAVGIGGAMALVSFMVLQLTDYLPKLQDQLANAQEAVVGFFASFGIDLSRVVREQVLNAENIISVVSAALSQLYNVATSILLILFVTAYMLVEVTGFRQRFYEALGEDRPALRRWLLWARDTRGYLWITTVLAFVVSILNFLLLLALGVPFPFTWAFLSFIMSYVPNVGFLIALVPPVALTLLQGNWPGAIGVFVGYVVINFLSDNIFKPRFLKTGMDLPVAVSFLSVLLWGFILGPIGALISVPMTMLVRAIFLEASPDTEQIALLLRSGAPAVRTKRRFLWWIRGNKGSDKGPPEVPPGNIPPRE